MFEITVYKVSAGKWARESYCVADKTTVVTYWRTKAQATAGHE